MTAAKLTLSLDKETIQAAKDYGAQHKLSLSKLIGRYFRSLNQQDKQNSPIVNRLLGILPAKISAEEHKKYLGKKYKL